MRAISLLVPLSLLAASCGGGGDGTSNGPEGGIVPVPTPTPTPSPTPTPTPTPPPFGTLNLAGKTLAVEGDELLLGPTSFVARYAAANPQLKIVNNASSGARIADLLARRDGLLAAKPDVLVISLGMHELCASGSGQNYVKAIHDYAKPFAANGTKVVVATPLPRAGTANATCDTEHRALRDHANLYALNGTYYSFDAILHLAGDDLMGANSAAEDRNLFSDGLHPTEAGQAQLFKTFDRVMGNVWSVILGVSAPVAPSKDGQLVVVSEGDSIGIAFGGSFHAQYRSSRSDIDEWHAMAIGGSSIKSARARIGKVLMKNPDIVSLYIGSNDLGGYGSAAAFTAEVEAYATALRQRGIKLFVFTLPNRITNTVALDTNHNILRKQLAAVYSSASWVDGFADVAAEPGVGADNAPNDRALFSDGLHPTEAGHALIYKLYKPAFDRAMDKAAPL